MKRGKKPRQELGHIADLYTQGKSLREIAAMVGKTHQSVSNILKVRGVQMRPCPAKGRRPKDQVIYYRGNRYTWSTKGYWRCTSMHDRHNLARRIWEENFGPIPSGYEVFYKDGDRYNIDIYNLGCMSRSERQKERMKDPNYKDMIYAYSCYGRLNRQINESLDPNKARERGRKIWETRKQNPNYMDAFRKLHETRKARYGKSGVKDPEAVRMTLSLAHMGKKRKAVDA